MKKLLIFIILAINAFAIDIYVGANMSGATSWDTDVSPMKKTNYDDPIYGLNVEIVQSIPFVELGLGTSYETGFKTTENKSYDAVPIYVLAKYNLFPKGVKPYLVAKYGLVLYQNEENCVLDNGAYYSVGVGITLLRKLQLEGSYSLATGEMDNKDLNLTTAGLTLRYNVF